QTGKYSDEAAHEGDEAPEQHGLDAVLIEETLRLGEARRREEDPLSMSSDEALAAVFADPIASLAANDRPNAARDDDADERQRSPAGECGGRDERRLARHGQSGGLDE